MGISDMRSVMYSLTYTRIGYASASNQIREIQVCKAGYGFDVGDGACLQIEVCKAGYGFDIDDGVCLQIEVCKAGYGFDIDPGACLQIEKYSFKGFDIDGRWSLPTNESRIFSEAKTKVCVSIYL
jgi:hypothetical protein